MPCPSSSAVSTAHLAKLLPWTALPIRSMACPTRVGSQVARIGAMYVSIASFMPLRAFRPVGQAADRRPLADADDPVRHADADDHERLAVHHRHGQVVRTDRRHIQEDGLDFLDHGRCVLHGCSPVGA